MADAARTPSFPLAPGSTGYRPFIPEIDDPPGARATNPIIDDVRRDFETRLNDYILQAAQNADESRGDIFAQLSQHYESDAAAFGNWSRGHVGQMENSMASIRAAKSDHWSIGNVFANKKIETLKKEKLEISEKEEQRFRMSLQGKDPMLMNAYMLARSDRERFVDKGLSDANMQLQDHIASLLSQKTKHRSFDNIRINKQVENAKKDFQTWAKEFKKDPHFDIGGAMQGHLHQEAIKRTEQAVQGRFQENLRQMEVEKMARDAFAQAQEQTKSHGGLSHADKAALYAGLAESTAKTWGERTGGRVWEDPHMFADIAKEHGLEPEPAPALVYQETLLAQQQIIDQTNTTLAF